MDTLQPSNCRSKMNKYLMNKNTAYRLRIPISFLIAIVVSVFMKKASSLNNFFIAHVLIPIAVFLIVWFSIDIGVRNNVSKEKLNLLEEKCQSMLHQDKVEKFNNLMKKNHVSDEHNNPKVKKSKVNKHKVVEEEHEKIHNLNNYVSSDSHHLKPVNDEDVKVDNINRCTSNHMDEDKYAHPNTNNGNAIKRYYSNFPLGNTYPPISKLKSSTDSGCLLGKNNCSPLCSGTGKNSCNIVAPIPGPQWQVQSANTVQNRLNKNIYVPSTCPLGPTILRDAKDCKNLTNENAGSCQSTEVECNNSRMFN